MGQLVPIPLATGDWRRGVAKEARIPLKNRYYEGNPVLTDSQTALIARPGLRFLMDLGNDGPIRGIYSQPGSFNGDMFVASYDTLFRVNNMKVATAIFPNLTSPTTGFVNMAITASIGETPAYLFFADGSNLYVYIENGYATGVLSGNLVDTDVVNLGGIYYMMTAGSVDAGAPAGTAANPWRVAVSGDPFANLLNAINSSGSPGTMYSTVLVKNPNAQAVSSTGGSLRVIATAVGLIGNAVVTTTTAAGAAWTGPTLSGGGTPYVQEVQVPDDVGAIDVCVSNSFVVVIPTQGDDRNGRFYWIEPGEIIIRPLNFATAESAPDAVLGCKALGDQFWLPGESTTEVWQFNGQAASGVSPVSRLNGVVFDRGTWEGTAVAIHESLIVCDAMGAVFVITGGIPKRVSDPDIEESIRKAIQTQQLLNL